MEGSQEKAGARSLCGFLRKERKKEESLPEDKKTIKKQEKKKRKKREDLATEFLLPVFPTGDT